MNAYYKEIVQNTGNVQVWYCRPEFSRLFNRGVKSIPLKDEHMVLQVRVGPLSTTHIQVGSICQKEVNLDEVYRIMQGEVWSPNGEARDHILSLGLEHTSMSVGDILVVNGTRLMVDPFEFTYLGVRPTNIELGYPTHDSRNVAELILRHLKSKLVPTDDILSPESTENTSFFSTDEFTIIVTKERETLRWTVT